VTAYRYFAVVNSFSNAAGELVSERLFPLPYVWDDDDVPPMPTDPLPECFVPIDDGTPKYQANVPKLADPGFHKAIPGEGFNDCDTCGNIRHSIRIAEAQEKASKLLEKASTKRKLDELDEVDLPAGEAEAESATSRRKKKVAEGRSTAAREASSKDKKTVEPVKRS
jgi:hypothetical protein